MLKALITLAADQPRMTMLNFEYTSCGMQENRDVEVNDLLIKRPYHFIVEIAVSPASLELDRFHAEIVDGAAQLTNRLLNVRQIDPRATNEAAVALYIFGCRVVISARQLASQFRIDFVDQRPVIRNQNLHIESILLHEFGAQLKIPASFFERMNFITIAVIGGNIPRHSLAKANIEVAVVLLNFEISLARVGDFVDETQGPIVSIAVDIH